MFLGRVVVSLDLSCWTEADLIALHIGVERILSSQHGTADEYARQNHVTVIRMVTEFVTQHTKPTQQYTPSIHFMQRAVCAALLVCHTRVLCWNYFQVIIAPFVSTSSAI